MAPALPSPWLFPLCVLVTLVFTVCPQLMAFVFAIPSARTALLSPLTVFTFPLKCYHTGQPFLTILTIAALSSPRLATEHVFNGNTVFVCPLSLPLRKAEVCPH